MIDLIRRSTAPAYKGGAASNQAHPGLLAGLWCYLFGRGSSPSYRSTSTSGPTWSGPAGSRCWWSLTGAPQYQTPPAPPTTSPEPETPCGDSDQSGCRCEPLVEGREIHLYPEE